MSNNPISNPGVSPTQPSPPYGPSRPSIGAGEEGQEKPFSLAPQGEGPSTEQPEKSRPSPMEIAGDTAQRQTAMPSEELTDQINKLKNNLGNIQNKLQDANVTNKFSDDHHTALQRITQKMNPDMQSIAKNSKGEFKTPEKTPGEGMLSYVSQWIGGAQDTLGGALDYLKTTQKPDITSYLKLQYSIQRATQRGELFASIVGSSVSGVKTIMSTQLG